MPDTSVVEAVRVVGPLAPYAPRFADELRRRGYTECSTAGQLRLMAHASRWLANQGLDAAGFTPQRLAAFSADQVAAGYRGLRTVRALRPLEELLQVAGALPVPTAPEPESPARALPRLPRRRTRRRREGECTVATRRGTVPRRAPRPRGRHRGDRRGRGQRVLRQGAAE